MSRQPLKMDLLNVPKIQKMNSPLSILAASSNDEIGLGYQNTLVSISTAHNAIRNHKFWVFFSKLCFCFETIKCWLISDYGNSHLIAICNTTLQGCKGFFCWEFLFVAICSYENPTPFSIPLIDAVNDLFINNKWLDNDIDANHMSNILHLYCKHESRPCKNFFCRL